MRSGLQPGGRAGRGNDLAFTLIVGLAYLSLLTVGAREFALPRVVLLLLAGVVYVVVGTSGFALVERAGTRRAALAYFAVQIPLVVAISHLSGLANASTLALLPLAGQSVRVLPRRGWRRSTCCSWPAWSSPRRCSTPTAASPRRPSCRPP